MGWGVGYYGMGCGALWDGGYGVLWDGVWGVMGWGVNAVLWGLWRYGVRSCYGVIAALWGQGLLRV